MIEEILPFGFLARKDASNLRFADAVSAYGDTEAMLCSNSLTNIVVGFEKSGETYIGKIKDMPMELTVRLAKMKDGDLLIKKTVLDAEEVFLKEMFEKNEEVKSNN